MLRLLLTMFALHCLTACTTNKLAKIEVSELLLDDVFPAYNQVRIESEQEIFALNQEAKEFADNAIANADNSVQALEMLTEAIFERSELGLLYMGHANTVAADTFNNRAANCLSLSIMAYSMAEHVGFNANFQQIDIPEFWTRREGQSLINGHINLKISDSSFIDVTTSEYTYFRTAYNFEIDFDRTRTLGRVYDTKRISLNRVVAMYYNNKGADALLSQNMDKAYAYFRAALMKDNYFVPALVNLGYLYRLNGRYGKAEQSYAAAIDIDKLNFTAWENLAFLYKAVGKEQAAQAIFDRVDNHRKSNPYYHFNLGEVAFERRKFKEALEYYRRALKIDKGHHQIYFGLAKTHYELGNTKRSVRYFERAKMLSRNDQDKSRYAHKLDMIARSKS